MSKEIPANIECLDCGYKAFTSDLNKLKSPYCKKCGGLLKIIKEVEDNE